MPKSVIYVSARSGARLVKAEQDRAVQVFQSTGCYSGDVLPTAAVMNYCLERNIGFVWRRQGDGRDGYGVVERYRGVS
jgi:hypothetical protein